MKVELDGVLRKGGISKEQVEMLKIAIRNSCRNPIDQNTWDTLDDISDEIEKLKINIKDKTYLFFEAFEAFPRYYHFLLPLYNYFRDGKFNDEIKDIIFSRFLKYLKNDLVLKEQVGYLLWVEFFEDSNTVEEAWNLLVNQCKIDDELELIILLAGPVPFDLKLKVYEVLVRDKKYHASILKSLLFSVYDVYGKIDLQKVSTLIDKLDVDKKNEDYRLLFDKLNK